MILVSHSASVLCLWGCVSLFHLICMCVLCARVRVKAGGGLNCLALLPLLILLGQSLPEPGHHCCFLVSQPLYPAVTAVSLFPALKLPAHATKSG